MRNELKPTHALANNLALLLEKKHITANQLAQALQLPLMTIRRLLSSETEDPRVSTLKLIADYFGVSIDFLIHDHDHARTLIEQHIKAYRVPKLSWESLVNPEHLCSRDTMPWEPILVSHSVGARAFALESKPSMHPRFPRGTLFIIDPDTPSKDGDVVLVHFKENNSYNLKELIVDPPEIRLHPLVTDSLPCHFNEKEHSLAGVVIATLFYQHKTNS